MRRTQPTLPKMMAAAMLIILLVVGRNGFVVAETANFPSLAISQLKITSSNGQFITLYNSTDTAVDMSKYALQYFNSYDLAKATSSKLISLSGTVPPHGYFMVNDSALTLCFKLTINSVSLGLSSTSGLVELIAFGQISPGVPAAPLLQDYIGWSKTPVTGAQTLPANNNAFLQRQPVDVSNNPNVKSPGGGSWQTVQPDDGNPCRLMATSGTVLPTPSGLGQLLPSGEPPATIVSVLPVDSGPVPVTIPSADIGLKAPQITEMLPNPSGTGNDSTDEYIELYNSNDKPFDLSGFVLQSGATRLRNYTFPNGTRLEPRSFKAFYADTTDLTLSNTGSQAKLNDPLGNSISSIEMYSNAKDGQAWALAKGKWYWTTQLTPGKANVIKQTAKKLSSGKKPPTPSKQANSSSLPSGIEDEPSIIPIHTRTIALIAGLAILYGAYEYRVDARNRIYQLRRHFSSRRQSRPKS